MQSTPLHYAAVRNHPEAVNILLESNADVEMKDCEGNQPIHLAAWKDNNEYVDVLIIIYSIYIPYNNNYKSSLTVQGDWSSSETC